MTVTPLEIANAQLQLTVMLASTIMAWKVTAEIVDRYVAHRLGASENRYFIIAALTSSAFFMSTVLPCSTFLTLCVASVVLALTEKSKSRTNPALISYMKDMVAEARLIPACHYSGFDNYIHELDITLRQREKNNGVLVGPAGVGKSAIFEMIAWKIAHNQFPEDSPFHGKRLISIDVSAMIAGTIYVGQVEDRVQQFLKFAEKSPGCIFVFDEIHRILGAGVTQSNLSGGVGNQLKPYLARPGLKVLGATTDQEYTTYIARDVALSRRFARTDVQQPNSAECIAMIQNRRDQGYYAPVIVTDEAIQAAVFFTGKDIRDRVQPDKANSLLDRAQAEARAAHRDQVTLDEVIALHKRTYSHATLEQFRSYQQSLSR
jgi:ATP-dependent Clp protease ATP-binding subunit ClpA